MESEPNTNNLSIINLKIHELNNNVKSDKDIKPPTYDLHSESTQEPPNNDDVITYTVPEFSDGLINDLTNDNDIIFNKNYKPETYKNKALFYIYLTHEGRTVTLYAYGYKPEGYKHIDNLGNLYFGCADWFILDIFNPLTQKPFYKLTPIIYYFNKQYFFNYVKKIKEY